MAINTFQPYDHIRMTDSARMNLSDLCAQSQKGSGHSHSYLALWSHAQSVNLAEMHVANLS